jgi:hypothetical protein
MHGSRSKISSKKSRPYIYIYDVKFLAVLGAPYIYDVKFLAVLGVPYIYDISRLRVNIASKHVDDKIPTEKSRFVY